MLETAGHLWIYLPPAMLSGLPEYSGSQVFNIVPSAFKVSAVFNPGQCSVRHSNTFSLAVLPCGHEISRAEFRRGHSNTFLSLSEVKEQWCRQPYMKLPYQVLMSCYFSPGHCSSMEVQPQSSSCGAELSHHLQMGPLRRPSEDLHPAHNISI